METPSEEVAFFTAREMAAFFGVAVPTIRGWASEAEAGSLFAQCWRGRWHRSQLRLMEAVFLGAISRESGEARWRHFKHEVGVSLPPEMED